MTWSRPFRAFLRDALPELQRLPRPALLRVSTLRTYNRTFSMPCTRLQSLDLQRRLLTAAHSLSAMSPPSGLVLLDSMLDDGLRSHELRLLFALLRAALVDRAGDPHAALYSPLGETGRHVREFALHADLYIPDILLNVFDSVPSDDSGACLFFPVAKLTCALSGVKCLPASTRRQILRMFETGTGTDRFDELYDLLHGYHPWTRELENALAAETLRIKLRRGQGYLLHDRRWLHGREAPSGGVPKNRLHRLVFRLAEGHRGPSDGAHATQSGAVR